MVNMLETEFHDVTGNSKDTKVDSNGPVFFLIREQAKSVVAIKELRARLTVLEELQESLVQAVQNVQHHLISDKATLLETHSKQGTTSINVHSVPPLQDICSNQHVKVCSGEDEFDLKEELLNLVPTGKSDSKVESINKDSGVLSDYKEQSSDSSYNVADGISEQLKRENYEDELLHLLDIIDQKSLQLLQQVEDAGVQQKKVPETDSQDNTKLDSITNHYTESVITQRQLCEVKADRDELKQRLSKLESATDTVIKEKNRLQKRLENMVKENLQLQTKIKSVSDVSLLESNLSSKSLSSDIEKATMRKKYMQYSEKSRVRVTRVLKESNILELQRQLLTYIMENDVLQAKLEQSQPNVLPPFRNESSLRMQIENLKEDKKFLEETLKKKKCEIQKLKEKVKILEDKLDSETAMKNFGMGSTDDWRQPSGLKHNGNVNPFSPMEFGDFSKTQSLPVTVRLSEPLTDQQCPAEPIYNAENFVDVSLNNSCHSEQRPHSYCDSHTSSNYGENLLHIDEQEANGPTSSTLPQPQYWNQPSISANWSTPESLYCGYSSQGLGQGTRKQSSSANDFNAKLVNGHLCWKSNSDKAGYTLDSICSEFDPLSGTPSCENFVDSLNLSIPLKPAQILSQLSSVGDSLHSASLDLGCASSAAWHQNYPKLASAYSADGIRQMLAEQGPNFYRNKPLPNFIQNNSITSVISGKTAHHRPPNVIECMHSFTENKYV